MFKPLFYSVCLKNFAVTSYLKPFASESVSNRKQSLMTVYAYLGSVGDV